MKFLGIIFITILVGISMVDALKCYKCATTGSEVPKNPCYKIIEGTTPVVDNCVTCTLTFKTGGTGSITRDCSPEPMTGNHSYRCTALPKKEEGQFCSCVSDLCNNRKMILPVRTTKPTLSTTQSTIPVTIEKISTTEETSGTSIVEISSLTLFVGAVLAQLPIF